MKNDTTGNGRTPAFLLTAAVLTFGAPTMPASAAPLLTTLYSFHGGPDGAGPISGLVADGNGALYGTTPAGGGTGCGNNGCGTVFKLTPPTSGQTTWTETVIYSFSGGADGATPMAALAIDHNRVIYGTTSAGGSEGVGTVFSLTAPSQGQTKWNENVIYAFKNDGHDGMDPVAPVLVDKSGNLYGTTMHGGMAAFFDPTGLGTAFRLAPPAAGNSEWTETQLWAFNAGPTDGAYPQAGLIMDAGGALYGATTNNYGGIDCGSVFQLTPGLTPDGPWIEITLAALQAPPFTTCHPTGLLYMDSRGHIYDTALGSPGFSYGAIFDVVPPVTGQSSWTINTLYAFTGPVRFGANPYSGVIADSVGNLYGTTSGGVDHNKPYVGAQLFELSPPAAGQTSWTEKPLVKFDGTNGSLPKSGLLKTKDGTIYGTTQAGGAFNLGTVFALTRPGK